MEPSALAVSEQKLNVMNNENINVLCSTDLNALDKINPLNNKLEVFHVKTIFYKMQKENGIKVNNTRLFLFISDYYLDITG